MMCPICRSGRTVPGATTVTLERQGMTLVLRNVPARVCDNCGEDFVEEGETKRLLSVAEDALKSGAKIELRDYKAA
ncbi:MAG: type II toxin-antitoxin system MqsA family antitoxin [Alphaproteobacteria bacterium]|nr:type II toxin-antitoxin system MqsA family antitoxin [Alphaproteobacteria bacterium]